MHGRFRAVNTIIYSLYLLPRWALSAFLNGALIFLPDPKEQSYRPCLVEHRLGDQAHA